jgi:hypothetical protein
MTHRHDCFECPSPRDYVDTKSWLAYEQNLYSIDWARSGSCHRETSLGYDISLLSLGYKLTRISNFFTMRQHLDAPILGAVQPYHNEYNLELRCTPAWLGKIVTSMTRHLHCTAARSPQLRHRQHDSVAPRPHGLESISPAWHSSIVTSMTQHMHRATAKSPRQRRP